MRSVARIGVHLALGGGLVAIAVACGGATQTSVGDGTDGGGTDGGSSSTTDSGLAGFPGAGTFCTGDAPRMMVNGAEVVIEKAKGRAVVLNCCNSAELILATGSYQALFYLLWRAPAGQSPGLVDLGKPPADFSIELDLGCDPATAPCNTGSAEEHYSSGFQGQISFGNASTTSYCISVAEQKNSPHSVIHSLAIYAPNVASTL
jgi:hypothetical protein